MGMSHDLYPSWSATTQHHLQITMTSVFLLALLLLFIAPSGLAMSPITAPPAVPPENIKRFYPIGTPGVKWTTEEDDEWKAQVKYYRSYQEEVVDKIEALKQNEVFQKHFCVEEYGCIEVEDDKKYPLFAIRSQGDWKEIDAKKLTMLVTGGVHGYETSGVQGALLFVQQLCSGGDLSKYLQYNICVCPCVTPWAYGENCCFNCCFFCSFSVLYETCSESCCFRFSILCFV